MNNIKTNGREQLLYSICASFLKENFDKEIYSILKEITKRLKPKVEFSLNTPKRKLIKTVTDKGGHSEYEFARCLISNVFSQFGIEDYKYYYLPNDFLSKNCGSCRNCHFLNEEYLDFDGKTKNRTKYICADVQNCKKSKVHKIIELARRVNRVVLLRDAYVDVFLYSECSLELFNSIISLYNYDSRTSSIYKQVRLLVISSIENEIFKLHGNFIDKLLKNYHTWKQRLRTVYQ